MECCNRAKLDAMGFRLVSAFLLVLVVTFSTPLYADEPVPDSEAEQGTWKKVGKELGETAGAVGDASKKSWDKTKEVSGDVWDKTKEKSGQAWDKTKDAGANVAEGSGEVVENVVETSQTAWGKTKQTTSGWWEKAKSKVHEMTAPSPEK